MATSNTTPNPPMGLIRDGKSGETVAPEPVSPWLYLSGLMAVLAAVYAVNFGLESLSFGAFSMLSITLGFSISYALRRRRASLRSLQIPVLLIVVLIVAGIAASDRGMEWLWPSGVSGDRQKAGQVLLTWLLILLSYLLNSNGAVLFCIVPSFAMLALVSQSNTEAEVQNSFLLFVTATTFLMVHDNFLRTRQFQAKGRTQNQEKQLFGGQFQLAALCVMGALVFANVVAVPLRTIGMSVFSPSTLASLTSNNDKQNQPASSLLQVTETNSVELANGPVSISDMVLMRVASPRGVNWRGTTFDYYTGTKFENHETNRMNVAPSELEASIQMKEAEYRGLGGSNTPDPSLSGKLFTLPTSPFELATIDMVNPQTLTQTFIIVGGSFSQLYGATSVTRVLANIPSLQIQNSGGMLTGIALPANFRYQVTSSVPEDSPDELRKSPSEPKDYPNAIKERYLQIPQESSNLRKIVTGLVQGLKNNYDKLEAIKSYISKTCKYNIQSPRAPRDRDLVEYFITESKMGYCDSFGATLVMMCRYAGIPARLVSGFLSGDHKDGVYVVKEKHKHLWAEVYFPKYGWVTADATEGAEDISDYSSLNKKDTPGFVKWLMRDGIRVGVSLVILLLLVFIFKNEILGRIPAFRRKAISSLNRPATNQQIIGCYLEASLHLRRYGLVRAPSHTPAEFAALVSERSASIAPELATHWNQLTELFARFRYGQTPATESEVQQARASLNAIQIALKGVKRNALLPPRPPKAQKVKA